MQLANIVRIVIILLALMTITTQAIADEPPQWRQTTLDFATGEKVNVVALEDNFAYVGMDMDEGNHDQVMILDITDPMDPQTLASVYVGTVIHLSTNEDFLYSASNRSIHIIDVSVPSAPSVTAKIVASDHTIHSLAYYEDHLYIGAEYGFSIVDVSNPTKPEVVSIINNVFGSIRGIAVSHDPTGESDRVFAYLVGDPDGYQGGGLNIIDVTNPENPIHMNSGCGQACYTLYYGIYDLVLEGHYVYLPQAHLWHQNRWGLHVVDVSDATKPIEVNAYLTPGIEQFSLTLIGDQLYMLGKRYEGRGEQLMSTIDVAARDMLHQTGQREMAFRRGSAQIESHQGCLYIPQGEDGLKILCESNVTLNPRKNTFLPLLSWFEE